MSEEKLTELRNVNIVLGAYGSIEDCVGVVEPNGITQPPEGGIFTKYMGCNYLFKGYPDSRKIEAIRTSKKILSVVPRFLARKPTNLILLWILPLVFLFPKSWKKKLFIEACDCFFSIAYYFLFNIIPPPEKYCVSVREIYRALTVVFDERIKDDLMMEMATKWRDTVCMTNEYDFAYRARKQNVLPEINIEALKKNPIKELNRVFDILIRREPAGGIRRKWIRFKIAILFYLRLNKGAREFVVRFLTEIDYKKIKMDDADWYYCLRRPEFNFSDISFEDRMKQVKIMDEKVGNKIPKVTFREGIPPGTMPVEATPVIASPREATPEEKVNLKV